MSVSVNLEDYNKVFETIVRDLVSEGMLTKEMPVATARFEELLRYNIPHWTEIQGYVVATTYAELLGNSLTEEKRHLSYVLGWCWQMIQGVMGLLDDFLDNDDCRFEKPTWFRREGNDRIGVNDAVILEQGVYRLIFKYFGNSPVHSRILEYFSSFLYETALAQSSEIPKPTEIWADVEAIFDEFAYFYTLRNDYYDSFLENVSCDNDIKTGKWKWLALKAKEMCTEQQWATLKGSYGKDDLEAVNIVRGIYKDLGLPEMCGKELLALRQNLETKVASLTKKAPVIGNITMNLLKWYRLSVA